MPYSQGVHPSYMRLSASTLVACRSSTSTCSAAVSARPPRAPCASAVPSSLAQKRASTAPANARRSRCRRLACAAALNAVGAAGFGLGSLRSSRAGPSAPGGEGPAGSLCGWVGVRWGASLDPGPSPAPWLGDAPLLAVGASEAPCPLPRTELARPPCSCAAPRLSAPPPKPCMLKGHGVTKLLRWRLIASQGVSCGPEPRVMRPSRSSPLQGQGAACLLQGSRLGCGGGRELLERGVKVSRRRQCVP